jgi:3-oxoacyl-[acyl-carrier-protein] synthase-3
LALFINKNVKISGIAATVPKNEIDNLSYDWVPEKERLLFIQTTGVKKRRVADSDICTSDMCHVAAEKLLSELNWKKNEIDILIFVSQSADYYCPSTSVLLQDRLGLSKSTMAFDINLGCSGYVYGLSVISSLLASGAMKKGLLLVGDKSSYSLNPRDKTTFPLFGDAGTATALEFSSGQSIPFHLQSDGSGKDAIIIPGGGTREPFNYTLLTEEEQEPGIIRHRCNLHLNGMDVFNFSLKEVKPNIETLLQFAEREISSVDFVIMHQANLFMNEAVRKKLKVEKEKVPISIDKFGNTSSASIPLTMVSEISDSLKKGKVKSLLSGFGVGFSWGSALIETENIAVPELIYI